MANSVKLSGAIISEAKIISKVLNRSVSGQIEHWAKIGKIAEANQDLTFADIMAILIAKEEMNAKNVVPYEFD